MSRSSSVSVTDLPDDLEGTRATALVLLSSLLSANEMESLGAIVAEKVKVNGVHPVLGY